MSEAQDRRLPFRQLVIIPEGAPELLDRLDRIIPKLPKSIMSFTGNHKISLGEVRKDWLTSDGPVYVGPIPGYPDPSCGIAYIPREILADIENCIRGEISLQSGFSTPRDIKAIDI